MKPTVEGISPETKVYGLFGTPISHSLSPLMHNTAFQSLGYPGIYKAFQVEPAELGEAVQAIRDLNIAGVNVTIPHKTSIIPYLDEIGGDAALTGSVNTICNVDGRLIGTSTDGIGFVRSLREEAEWEPRGQSVVILGAGGAAVAVAFRLVREGVRRMLIVARSVPKSVELAEKIREKTGFAPETGGFEDADLPEKAREFGLVVNTTPLGMASHSGEAKMPPFSPDWLVPGGLCYDLVYNPLETEWLSQARKSGKKRLSGLGMLVFQGAESFRLWTGLEMPVTPVRRALTEALR